MASFKDKTGASWDLSLTLGDFRRVKSMLGIDLLNIMEPRPNAAKDAQGRSMPLITELDLDLPMTSDVVYVLLKPQADERNITDEQFVGCLDGASLAAMHAAFGEALLDFFQKLGQTAKARAIAKQRQLVYAMQDLTERKIDAIDVTKIQRMTERSIDESMAGDSPIELLGSLALTQPV